MLDLTSQPLLVLSVLLTGATAVTAVVVRFRGGPDRRAAELAARGGLVVAAQVLAVFTVFLVVNNQYGFYDTWADLLGQTSQAAPIVAGGASGTAHFVQGPRLGGHGSGTRHVMTVGVAGSRSRLDTLVWLPPQYSEHRYAATRFPVVMFLPGQPSAPKRVFQQYDFGAVASRAIAAGSVKPFVAVFPPLMIDPPRDTECTDVPGGPQALSWLTKDVPSALTRHFRVSPPGSEWSVMGWSTGGFCAAKVLLSRPTEFHAGVSFGGYFDAITDDTTGDLFHGSRTAREQNSPQWLYGRHGLGGARLLVVVGKQDREAWSASTPLLALGGSDQNLSRITFPQGGHNYKNYRAYLLPALRWLNQSGI
ncbi:alpha/beta hydrolase [Knoellia sp. Soil729]|uniref:alpha/beta hydrolase n=1 Tax=Knoellia sp. Soil729 TaxID=1736394 RepID=UPI0006FF3B88|nr:alpha/beta hydrolase-fold protein [Knoellia sp. Soil729]KRE40424.1 hypothetical protein ASG74_15805 [Knoellia sp. Soil729]